MKKSLFLFSFLLFTCLLFGQTIPKNIGYVSDYENIFTAEQKTELTNILLEYENNTTIEIAILTVPDFESDIADFAQKTATEWGIGKKDVNNGLLIVISKNRKVLRCQTGYGLEGYLPDGWLKHIGDSITSNYSGKYYEGTLELISKTKTRIGKEGYSEDNNKLLIDKNKKSKKDVSIIEWMLTNVPWYVWIFIIGGWIVLFIISPDTALWLLFFAFSKGKDSGDSKGFGGGGFGGGGSSSKW